MILATAARFAVYYAPRPEDPLWSAGCAWIGRDAASGRAIPQPLLPGIAEVTALPRLYGFHATLKPPMRLAKGTTAQELRTALQAITAAIAPFPLPRLAVGELDGFLALRPTEAEPRLNALCDAVVAGLDRLRAPLSPKETARYSSAGLSPLQRRMLQRWGYPHVFAAWRFHMTLTRKLSSSEFAFWKNAVEAHFQEALRRPREVRDVCLFLQPKQAAAFRLVARFALRG